jgi:hypothetical protein
VVFFDDTVAVAHDVLPNRIRTFVLIRSLKVADFISISPLVFRFLRLAVFIQEVGEGGFLTFLRF